MTGRELHRYAYDLLIEYKKVRPDFTFWFRQRGEEKFKSGLIFQGNDNYAFVGLYDRGGGTNMTRSVGVVFYQTQDSIAIKLENAFNEETEQTVLTFYEQMREIIGGFTKTGKTNYQKFFNASTQLNDLRVFLDDQKPELDKLLVDFGLVDMIIDEARFKKMHQKIQPFLKVEQEIKSDDLILMNTPLNKILFGPPGTGKTYNSIDKAVLIATGKSGSHAENKVKFDQLRKEGQIEFVTFHQGYSYEDFMVGIKPNIDSDQLTFKPHKGIFYSLVDRAKKNYIASRDQRSLTKSFEEVFEELMLPLDQGDSIKIPMSSGLEFEITAIDGNTIRFNKPKGGNTHTLSIETLKSFVEGKREVIGLNAYYNPLIERIKKEMVLMAPIEKPIEKLKKYVIIIDEINRANISKVFGELITLLEDDKRIDADNELSVTLPNGELNFSIPPNLYIIGTMNTADKSIALVDIALRRRFEFEGYYPDYEVLVKLSPLKSIILQKINEAIYQRKKTADFLIGHGYFMKEESLDIILLKKVIPLLTEYFSGRIEEVQAILKAANIDADYSTLNYKWNINSLPPDENHN